MTELWRQMRWYRAAASTTNRLVEVGTDADGCLAVDNDLIVSEAAVAFLPAAEVATWEETTPAAWAPLLLRYYHLNTGEPIGDAVPRLRGEVEAAAGAAYDPQVHRVSFNHAFSGEPFYRGGPGAAPDATTDEWRSIPVPRDLPAKVAVLDTGFVPTDGAAIAAGVEFRTPDDLDACFFPNQYWLGAEAGHGTFISALILRFSEGVRVKNIRVLDPDGWGYENAIIDGVIAVGEDDDIEVLNLSLGGYAELDERPALCVAIDALPDRIAVVAAAGNNGSTRPFWPAADTRPIAVAGLERDLSALAGFSNRGGWLDVGAAGVDLLSLGASGPYLVDEGTEVPLGSWNRWSGTSFAAPLVAAVIARRAVDEQISGEAAWQLIDGELRANGLRDWGPTLDVQAIGNGFDPHGE